MMSVLLFAGQVASAKKEGPAPEVQVTPNYIVDFEFDWGRDGVDCPTCNHGSGNSRLAFTDHNYRLWVAPLDIKTGKFLPDNGKGTQVDSHTAYATDFGNGPEWMFSSIAGSQLVYTRYQPDAPQSPDSAVLAIATQNADGTWLPASLPGGEKRQSPIGTQDLDDLAPRIHYQDVAKRRTFWRDSEVSTNDETKLPTTGFSGGSRRWVPGTHKIILTATGLEGTKGYGRQQVFLFDTDTAVLKQITDEDADHAGAMMWRAPEYDNQYVFFSVRNGKQLVVHRKLKDETGKKHWTSIIQLDLPPETPHLWSPEYFLFNGKSYIFYQMNKSANASDLSKPGVLAMSMILPKKAKIIPLISPDAEPRVRMDPEYFITAKGPYLYYNRYKLRTDTEDSQPEGVWRVDTRLGKPNPALQAASRRVIPEAPGELD